ncbi:MAG: hypothetical protein EBZ77_03220 [Chitinophagia bacterium]|nr:hypothetical protein [Chitinophagia bacterium]
MGDARWFKVSARFLYTEPPYYYKHRLILWIENRTWASCALENKAGVLEGAYNGRAMNLYQYLTNRWSRVYFFVPIPKKMHDGEKISLSQLNNARSELFIDDVSLELYR